MSANVDPIKERLYELEKSRRDKLRELEKYDPKADNQFRTPKSPEEEVWQNLVMKVLERLQELKEEMNDESFRPALRTIWYDLVSAALIDNNSFRLTKFNERIVDARDRAILLPNAFSDETRPDLDE